MATEIEKAMIGFAVGYVIGLLLHSTKRGRVEAPSWVKWMVLRPGRPIRLDATITQLLCLWMLINTLLMRLGTTPLWLFGSLFFVVVLVPLGAIAIYPKVIRDRFEARLQARKERIHQKRRERRAAKRR